MSYLDDNQKKITALYVAAYNRAPDLDGLNAWTNSLVEAGGTTQAFENIAEAFVSVALFGEIYNTSESNRTFVESVYLNMFGKPGDQEGIDAWTHSLDVDGISKGVFLASFLSAALGYEDNPDAPLNAEAMAHKAILENKIDVGIYYVDELGERTNVTTPGDVNDPAYVRSIEVVAGVTADAATVTTAKGVVAGWVAEGQPGDTFTLTTGIDNLTGTAGNDTFEAPVVLNELTDSNRDTLNSGDQINGGGGNNTLNATLADTGATTPVLTNVQTVNVQSLNGANTLNLASSTGVEQININGVVAGTNIAGVKEANVAVSGLRNDAATTAALKLDGIEGGDFTLGLENVGRDANAAGDNRDAKIELGAATLQNLTIDNGDGANFVNLSATTNLNALRTVEATGDGNLNVDLSVATNLRTVTTGAGDDRVTVAVGALAASSNAAIDLGAGQNTLVAKSVSASAFGLAGLALDGKGDNAKLTGVNTLEVQSVDATGNAQEISGIANLKGSGLSSLVLDGALAAAGVTITDASQAFTLGLKNAGAAGGLTFNSTATGLNAVNTESLTLNVDGATTLASLTSADLKSLTVNADGDTTFTSLAAASKLSSLTLNDVSEDGSTITAVAAANTALRTIDLSGNEDSVVIINAVALGALEDADGVAAPKESVTVNIGDIGTLDYTAKQSTDAKGTTADVAEIFKFTGEGIGSIEINNFQAAGVTGRLGPADKLDFSAFAGINSVDDLAFDITATKVVITAADEQFAGEITLVGLGFGTNVDDTTLTAADNFIF